MVALPLQRRVTDRLAVVDPERLRVIMPGSPDSEATPSVAARVITTGGGTSAIVMVAEVVAPIW